MVDEVCNSARQTSFFDCTSDSTSKLRTSVCVHIHVVVALLLILIFMFSGVGCDFLS